AREPGRAGQLDRRRFLPHADSERWSLLREQAGAPGKLRTRRHLLRPLQPEARLERAAASCLRAGRPEQRAGRAGSLVPDRGRGGAAVLLAQPATVAGEVYVARERAGFTLGPA